MWVIPERPGGNLSAGPFAFRHLRTGLFRRGVKAYGAMAIFEVEILGQSASGLLAGGH
ncbi:MAG TPA: hypothetical protein VKA04_05875 [Pseudodesulfovibrio sp.]|nr:hypothetical protein [Pseudodesulfovibrio sp.]